MIGKVIHDQTQAILDENKIDLQKTFDIINHKIFINKMDFLGFSKDVILWFKSYLLNRKFKVNLDTTFPKLGNLYVEFLKDLF